MRNESIPAAISLELGEQGILGEELNESSHSEWLQPLIDEELTPEEATERKRTIATALIKGMRDGSIEPMEAPDIAALIDEGVTRMTVAKQVGEGTMDPVKAMETFIDHAAARVITIADNLITKVEKGALERSDVIADTLVDRGATALKVLAASWPPTRVLVPFIDSAAQYIKPGVRMLVKKGITMVADTARTIVKNAVPFIADRVKQGVRAVKSFFSSLLPI